MSFLILVSLRFCLYPATSSLEIIRVGLEYLRRIHDRILYAEDPHADDVPAP